MKTVASTMFADASSHPAEASPASSPEAGVKPFERLLAGRSGETSGVESASPAVFDETREDALPADDAGQPDDAEDTSDSKPAADPAVLSSYLAMWQILPPVPSVPVPVAEVAESTACISSANEEAGQALTISALATQPDGGPAAFKPPTDVPAGPSQSAGPAAPEAPAEPTSTVLVEPAVAVPNRAVAPEPASPMAAPSANAVRPANSFENSGSRPLPTSAEVPRIAPDGIPVAKEQRAMSEPLLHRPAKSAPAAFAEIETLPETGRAAVSEGGVPVNAMPEHMGREEADGGTAGGDEQRGEGTPFTVSMGMDKRDGFELPDTEAKPIAAETAQVIEHIERAIEQMRTQGGQRMEMRLPMRGGEEVVVKLRIEHGEVKATFQSASEGLRQALETRWSHASQGSPERAAKAAPAVFESPSMQSGMGGFQQQSPGQRERGGSGQDSEAGFTASLSHLASAKAAASRQPTTASAPRASLALYA